jgi:hypothetical protein
MILLENKRLQPLNKHLTSDLNVIQPMRNGEYQRVNVDPVSGRYCSYLSMTQNKYG